MTPQEQQMIEGLIQRVQNAPISEKDFDAEQLLNQGLGRNPNALYILAQTVLVQSYALEQAQKQLADAKAALAAAQQQAQQQAQQLQPPPRRSGSFLGSFFNANEPAPPPPSPPQPQYTPVPTYAQPQPQYAQPYPPPQYAQPYAQPSAGGGFLRGAAQTAAGVAAGALAFEGIESLMHGFGGHSGSSFGGGGFGGGGFGSDFGNAAPREEIINNYYGDSSPSEHEHSGHSFADNDIEGRSSHDDDTGGAYADTSSDDDSSYDTASNDDSSFDDTGSNDDSSFS